MFTRQIKTLIKALLILSIFLFSGRTMGAEFPLKAFPFPYHLTTEWNEGKETINLLKNYPGNIAFTYFGDRARVSNPQLVIYAPPEIEILSAFPYLPMGSRPLNALERLSEHQKSVVQRQGKQYSRHTFSIGRELVARIQEKDFRWGMAHYVFLQPKPSTSENSSHNIFWHLVSGGVKGEEHVLRAVVHPPLAHLPNPQNIYLFPWWSGTFLHPEKTMRSKLYELHEEIGVRKHGLVNWFPELSLELEDRGWTTFLISFHGTGPHGFPREELRAKHKDADFWIVGYLGETHYGIFCPTYKKGQGEHFIKAYSDRLKGIIDTDRYKVADAFFVNFEPHGPAGTFDGCFCERCLKAFSEHSKIPLENLSSPTEILTNFRDEWIKFRVGLNIEFHRLDHQLIKSLAPRLQVSIVAGELFPGVPLDQIHHWHGVDPRLYDDFTDEHQPMLYETGKRLADIADLMAQNLKKPVSPLLATMFDPWAAYAIHPHDVRLNMLASVSAGARRLGFYANLEQSDALYLKVINQTMADIAKVEDYFIKGERADDSVVIKGLPERVVKVGDKALEFPRWERFLSTRVWKLGESLLLTLFNHHKQEDASFLIKPSSLPDIPFLVYNPIKGIGLLNRNGQPSWSRKELEDGFIYRVGKYNASFLIITPYQEGKVESFIDLREEYEKLKKGNPSPSPGSFNLGVDDIDQDGFYELTLLTPTQKVWFNLEGGRIWEWRLLKEERNLVSPATFGEGALRHGGLCLDLFWVPHDSRWSGEERAEYSLVSQKETKDAFLLTFERELVADSLRALKITKTYAVSKTAPVITLHYTVEDNKFLAHPFTFAFWSHNSPKPGLKELKEKGASILSGLELIIPTPEGLRRISGIYDPDQNIVYATANAPLTAGNEAWEERQRMGIINENWFATYNPFTREALAVQVEMDKLLQVYSWRGEPPTFEWMYRPATLSAGGKWETKFSLFYLQNIEPTDIAKKLEEITAVQH